MYRNERVNLIVSPHILAEAIRDAHEYYLENNVDERYEAVALDLVRRYLSIAGLPRENDSLFAAALYIVTRHPWSYPNPLTKTEFAAKIRIKESSLDWYTNSIVETLGFLVFHDRSQLPFFIDPNGVIANVINAIVKTSVGEEVVLSMVRGGAVSPAALAERIVDRLCNIVKIIPDVFEQELYGHVMRKIEEESQRLLHELGGR